jgi:hypothetical protein
MRKYADALLPDQIRAFNAILECRTHEAGEYLFKEQNLAKVFRAPFLTALKANGFSIPKNVPLRWIVDCERVGKSISVSVISEINIIADQNGQVTFRYVESKTKKIRFRTEKGEDFIWLVLQHVLPKGFRRVRDYGFLHANAKKLLSLVQLVLHIAIQKIPLRSRPAFKCPCCKSPMKAIGFRLKPG